MLALAAFASGCTSSSGQSSPGVKVKAPAFRADIATWNLPLDAYLVTDAQEGYAQALLYSACMRPTGAEIPAIDPGDYLPPNKNKEGYKLFSVAIAQKWGYHNGPAKRLPTPAPKLTAAAQAHDATCNTQAQNEVSNPASQFVQGLGVAAYETAIHAGDVTAAAAAWHECMLPQGVPDLPATPFDMPTERLAEQFGLAAPPANQNPDVIVPPTTATPDEIRLATSDAQCRDSSHFTATLYDDQVQIQLELIKRNEQKLQQALAAEHAEAAKIADVLQQYGH